MAFVHYTSCSGVGGVETVIFAQMMLVGQQGGGWSQEIVRRGEGAVVLRAREPLAELRTALRGFDAVIVHNVLTMPFDLPLTEALWRLAGEMSQMKWIAWIHDLAACNPDYDHPWHRMPWRRLTQASPHFTYVAVSEHRSRQFEALTGVKPRVIPNGIWTGASLGTWRVVENARLFDREIVLIHPARLVRRKRIEVGFEVVAELRRRGRDAMILTTAAPDPHNAAGKLYAKELRARREQLGLKKAALFLGAAKEVSTGDLNCFYDLSDALFFPSRQEGFGLPVLEAAYRRLPIFCTDIEPLNSLLGHGVQTFAPDASPAEIATLIERTLDRSPTHRARREVLRRYRWEVIWKDHLEPLLREH